jgi:HEPN domain-containing protein
MNDEFEEHKQQVLKWVEIAEEDIRLAKFAFKMESNIPYRLICYHSQQCAEKYLKAFLVSKLIDFPYTHNINTLINLCPVEYDLDNKLSDTFHLTNYAIAKRYPR